MRCLACPLVTWVVWAASAATWLPAAAQLRDPTLAPAAALAAAPAASAAATPADVAAASSPLAAGAAVLVRDGQAHLVVGARIYAQGQKWGPYTLERIGETEVWLRAGKVLQKVQLFSGIERHTATERPTP